MKFTEYINEETVQSEYTRQSTTIDKNLKQIMINWKKIKSKYEKQLKDEPNSWMGIGRGSELGDMDKHTSEMLKSYFKV